MQSSSEGAQQKVDTDRDSSENLGRARRRVDSPFGHRKVQTRCIVGRRLCCPCDNAKSRPPICLTDLLGRLLRASARRDRWGWTDEQAERRAPLVTPPPPPAVSGGEGGRRMGLFTFFFLPPTSGVASPTLSRTPREAPWADWRPSYTCPPAPQERKRRRGDDAPRQPASG